MYQIPIEQYIEPFGKKDVEKEINLPGEGKEIIIIVKSKEGYIAASQPIS